MLKNIIEIIIYLLGICWTIFILLLIFGLFGYIYDFGTTVDKYLYNSSFSALSKPFKVITTTYNQIRKYMKGALHILFPKLPVPNNIFKVDKFKDIIPTIPNFNIPNIPCSGLSITIPDPYTAAKCVSGTC
tara:strand:- start:72 stop:464 length:393 start_codon:yes stop_codon:yes gene_type:complete